MRWETNGCGDTSFLSIFSCERRVFNFISFGELDLQSKELLNIDSFSCSNNLYYKEIAVNIRENLALIEGKASLVANEFTHLSFKQFAKMCLISVDDLWTNPLYQHYL